jgi:hypothetical protein
MDTVFSRCGTTLAEENILWVRQRHMYSANIDADCRKFRENLSEIKSEDRKLCQPTITLQNATMGK